MKVAINRETFPSGYSETFQRTQRHIYFKKNPFPDTQLLYTLLPKTVFPECVISSLIIALLPFCNRKS